MDCIPEDMTIDSNNNIYVVGYDLSWDNSLKLLKYDNSGNQLFNKHFADFYIYNPLIKTDSNNNLYLTSNYRASLAKFDSSGDLDWQLLFKEEYINLISDLTIDSQDNIYIYCCWDSDDYSNHSVFVIEFDSSGNQLKHIIIEESNNNLNSGGLEIDSENNILVSGSCYYKQWIYWLRSYNSSADLKWTIESKFEPYPLFVLDSLDNIITVRETWDNITYERDLELIKYNKSGNFIWNHIFDSKFTDNFYYSGIEVPIVYQFKLKADISDNVYITWQVEIPNDSYKPDILMIEVNKSGYFERYLTWGGADEDGCIDLDIDSNNNIYLCSYHHLIKNPVSNGKSFYRTNLWYFLLILFGIFCFISLITLYFMIKPRIRKPSNLV
ncbi:MAG: hypothetical protein ACFFHD_12170 [Promethearchaeota archaeon]